MPQKLLKAGNYSREETIRGNTEVQNQLLIYFYSLARAKRAGVLGLGELAGAVGPEYRYINVEGYEDCLIEHFKEGQLTDEYCLPTSKLPGCSNSVWMQLKELYDPNSRVINDQDSRAAPPGAPPGADVPVGLGAPAYLSIPGTKYLHKSLLN